VLAELVDGASLITQVEEIVTGEGDKEAKIAAVKAVVGTITVQDIHDAITAAEEAGISIEAIGDFIKSQIDKISKD
jgi:hypothetical protein